MSLSHGLACQIPGQNILAQRLKAFFGKEDTKKLFYSEGKSGIFISIIVLCALEPHRLLPVLQRNILYLSMEYKLKMEAECASEALETIY